MEKFMSSPKAANSHTVKLLNNGFTLIELLVVISIIALLLSIIVPALGRAKDMAKKTICSSNLRSLSMAAIFYAEDNDGLTPCSTVQWSDGGVLRAGWVGRTCEQGSGKAYDEQIQIYGQEGNDYIGIMKGQLYQYIENIDGWKCPSDPDKEQLRSYGMAAEWWSNYTREDDSVLDSYPGMVFRKLDKAENPAGKFMFIDSVGIMRDGFFAIYCRSFKWWNIPNISHFGGTVNGYADGHIESYKFSKETIRDAKIGLASGSFGMPQNARQTEGGKEDLRFYQRATWGKPAE